MDPERAKARLMRKADLVDGCWVWSGPLDRDGYGHTRLFGTRRAHRAMWIAINGPIPAGLCVLHRCDNPPCVRPEHLFLGTQAENQYDRARKGRYAKGDEHHMHGSRKLAREQAEQICRRYEAGETQDSIAKAFGVSHSHVGRVVRGEYYEGISSTRRYVRHHKEGTP